jgi:hypothetical protein
MKRTDHEIMNVVTPAVRQLIAAGVLRDGLVSEDEYNRNWTAVSDLVLPLHRAKETAKEHERELRAAAFEAMMLLEKLSRVNGWYGDEQRVYDLLRTALA